MSHSARKIPSRMIYTCLRRVDVSGYEPIVDHPILLRTKERSQLSFAYKEFPGGRHSRFEHSIFIYHFTNEETKHLLEKGCIKEQQKKDLDIAAFVHDVGHGPFSHIIGGLLGYIIDSQKPKTHNDKGVELLRSGEKDRYRRTMEDVISLCKGNFEKVVDIVAKKTPEAKIISHHTVGTDKMGYTLVDDHHTGYLIDKPFFLDLLPFILYEDDELGVAWAEDTVAQVMRLQRVIQDMYIDVYLNKDLKQFDRFMQKAVELEINPSELKSDERCRAVDRIWDMDEGSLGYVLKNSKKEDVRQLMRRYIREELCETAIEFKIEGRIKKEVAQEEVIRETVSKEFSDDLINKYTNPMNLTRLERKLCDTFSISNTDLFVGLSADPKRIMPEDVVLFTPAGDKIGTLYALNPDHRSGLVERAEKFFALRIYVDKKYKDLMMSQPDPIIEIVEDDVKQK